MLDFNERVVPGLTSTYLYLEGLARYKFACRFVKKKFRVLDVACGTGYGTYELRGKTTSVIGLDKNTDTIKYARKNYKKAANFVLGNALDLPFPEEYFDVVVSFETIEHLRDDTAFLKEISRVLKKAGILILSTPRKRKAKSEKGVANPHHFREYTYSQISGLLNKYFKKVTSYGQRASNHAKSAYSTFLDVQNTRQKLVDLDVLRVRKLFSKYIKEKIWRKLGFFLGNKVQEDLSYKDFPILKNNCSNCNYFIFVCKDKLKHQ